MMKRFKEYDKTVSEEGEGAASAIPANVSGPGVSTDIPVVKPKDDNVMQKLKTVADKLGVTKMTL